MYAWACKGCDGGYVGMWTHCAESGSFPCMLRWLWGAKEEKGGRGGARWGQWAIRRGKGFTNKSDSLLEGWVGIGTCPESVSYRLWQDLIWDLVFELASKWREEKDSLMKQDFTSLFRASVQKKNDITQRNWGRCFNGGILIWPQSI